MMHKRFRGWGILILLMTSLALTACVRPYPGNEASAAQPTVIPIVTQPVVMPQEPISTPDNGQAPAEPVEVQAPTPAPLEPTAEPLTETTYIVVAGDTLFKIALEHDVTVDDIAAANGIIDIDSLEVGQKLLIPGPGSSSTVETEDTGQELTEETEAETETETETDAAPATPATTAAGVHVVKPGENLFRIGLQYGCSVEQLARHNGITTPNRISVGMEVQIPACN